MSDGTKLCCATRIQDNIHITEWGANTGMNFNTTYDLRKNTIKFR